MNPTNIFDSKSTQIGSPVFGVQVSAHRTCWPWLLCFVFLPPGIVPVTFLGHFVSALFRGLVLLLAIFLQTAVHVRVARRLGAHVFTVLLFPFGPLFSDGVYSLAPYHRLRFWLAGPLVNLAVGASLMLLPSPLLMVVGHYFLAYGCFSLVPIFPLAGGQILRNDLALCAYSGVNIDRQTLEVSRICICILSLVAVLNGFWLGLYVLFVLWITSYQALISVAHPVGVLTDSIPWFKNRLANWTKSIRRLITDLFLIGMLFAHCLGYAKTSNRIPSQDAPFTASLDMQQRRLESMESKLGGLETNFTALCHLMRAHETNLCPAIESLQRHLKRDTEYHAFQMQAWREMLGETVDVLRGDIRDAGNELKSANRRLRELHQHLESRQSMLESRLKVLDAATLRLAQATRQLEQSNRWPVLQTPSIKAQHSQDTAPPQRFGWNMMTILACIGLAVILTRRYLPRLLPWQWKPCERKRVTSQPSPGNEPTPPRPTTVSQQTGYPMADHLADASSDEHLPETGCANPLFVIASGNAVEAHSDKQQAGETPNKALRSPDRSFLLKPNPGPLELLQRLFMAAQRSLVLRIQYSPPQNIPWNIGCRSITGPVRARNDDYGLAFEVNGHQIVILADGVSGEPFGGKAAFWAIQCAAWSIMKQFAEDREKSGPHSDKIAAKALHAAASGLGRLAAACGVVHGLRTTLIIVVATPTMYGYAYIGDGKGYVLRSNAAPEQFLFPQREAEMPANLIAACLGPRTLGAPITGALSRQSGDLLVVGTDGIFSESVEWCDDYLHRLLMTAIQCDGHLQRAVDHELQQLASTKDNLGFLFDDNMTLALVGDRKLSPVPFGRRDTVNLQTHLVLPHAGNAIPAAALRA